MPRVAIDRLAVLRAEMVHAVEVSRIVQDWIALARTVEPALAAAKRTERTALLACVAQERGYKPPTVRRMVKAYRYLLGRAKSVGVDLDDVRAPLVCVEVVERLERANETLDPELRRSVLVGEVTFRELLKLEQGILEARQERQRAVSSDTRNNQVDWTAFAIELSDDLFGSGKLSFAFAANRKAYSQPARDLSVDWEVNYEEERIAIFLSPKIVFSEFRGKSILDQLPRAVMATFYYDKVIYVAWDSKEIEQIEGYVVPAPAIFDLSLEFLALMDLPTGRLNASVYRF